MSDLIDRQKAIDVIDKIFPSDSRHNEYTQGIACGAALAMEYIKQLPSAEQWVTVTEGLPDKDVPVLVYLFGDVPHIAWINRNGEWETEEFIIDCDYLPKAWMSLPEPYMRSDDECM